MHNSYDYVWNPYACKNTNYNIVSLGFVQKKPKKQKQGLLVMTLLPLQGILFLFPLKYFNFSVKVRSLIM